MRRYPNVPGYAVLLLAVSAAAHAQTARTVESQSLVILGASGPVLVSGCGHAGLINSLEHTRARISPLPPRAAIGGFHLFAASDETLGWTSELLAELGLGHLRGKPCSSRRPFFLFRQGASDGLEQS